MHVRPKEFLRMWNACGQVPANCRAKFIETKQGALRVVGAEPVLNRLRIISASCALPTLDG